MLFSVEALFQRMILIPLEDVGGPFCCVAARYMNGPWPDEKKPGQRMSRKRAKSDI